jgi:hypothetical protein
MLGTRLIPYVLLTLPCIFSPLELIAASSQIQATDLQANSSQQVPNKSPARISGHVYRADTGEPISDAVVSLEPLQTASSGAFPQARTESDGSFVFPQVAPGTYNIEADAVGFLGKSYGVDGPQSRPQLVSLKASQNIEGINFRLDAAGAISGTVYDENDKPVAGVMVLAAHAEYRPNSDRQIGFGDGGSTDEDGTFYISGLRPGAYYVRAGGEDRNPGHRFNYQAKYYPNTSLLDDAQPVQVTSGAEQSGIQIRGVKSEPAYTIKAKIIDPGPKTGQRSYDVTVNRLGSPPSVHSLRGESKEATFSLDGFPAGEYTVTAWAIDPAGDGWKVSGRGYAPARIADKDVEVNVEIGNGAEVRGKVRLEGSENLPTPIVRVVFSSVGHLGLNGGMAIPDQHSEFDIRDIPPGRYSFIVLGNAAYVKSARCSGRDYTIEPIDVGASTVLSDCEITLATDMSTISGEVFDEITPVPGWVVVAIPESKVLRRQVGYIPTAQTDSNGQFKILWAIPGDYFLFVVPPSEDHSYNAPDFADRNQADAQHVSLMPNATEIVRLKPSNIK